jgi:formylglycine-generating enzyme required for sulfatase activity
LPPSFAAHQAEVRRQTLSLTLIEEKLDEVLHGQHKLAASLEDLKAAFVNAPLWTEWEQFRKARPDAVKALNEADEHFLAGRRDQGAAVLIDLLKARGVGTITIARRLGLEFLSRGKVGAAKGYFDAVNRAVKTQAPALVRTATMLETTSSRTSSLAGWRCLPRGLVLNRQFRIEDEVGRGGMASVYRVVGVDRVYRGRAFALKVPAPALMQDEATAARFLQEIEVNATLSRTPHPAIVSTVGHVVLDDPHTRHELYGMVMEFVPGCSLAQLLALRKDAKQYLSPAEILNYLRPVCQALTHAHALKIFHRDLKPHNVMVTPEGQARLMDFGIARVLQEGLASLTQTGAQPGTLAYAPPEVLAGSTFDERSEVYLAANLLVELLTFHPKGDPESRPDCPENWLRLIADAMNQIRRLRPANLREFLERLELPETLSTGAREGEAPAKPSPQPRQEPRPPEDWLTAGERLRSDAEERHARARRTVAEKYDYAAAVALLEPLPDHLREAAFYAELCHKRDRVTELDAQIREDWTKGRTKGLRAKVQELLSLQPSRADLQQLLTRLASRPGETEDFVIADGVSVRMALVPKGTFWMSENDINAQRQVEIPHDFWLGIYPVTQRQWQAVMGSNPSHFQNDKGGGPDHPVEQVSWEDAQQFIQKLNAQNRERGWLYRLPTEAEWEYACRGGATSKQECSFDFYLDRPTNDLCSTQANFDGNHPAGKAATGPYLQRTSEVGSYPPNKLGIYDMHGNVWEWCEDSYDGGSVRVFRGGSWLHHASSCRAAIRRGYEPSLRYLHLGFRLARVPSGS